MNSVYVSQYNNIPRFGLNRDVNKADIEKRIRGMADGDKAWLLSKLVEIKYYRQTNPFHNVADPGMQHALWQTIEVWRVQHPPCPSLIDLMKFIKNDSFIVQRKLPSHLQNLLSDCDQSAVLRPFHEGDRKDIREFLNDATGTDWTGAAHVTAVPATQTLMPAPEHEFSDYQSTTVSTTSTAPYDRSLSCFLICSDRRIDLDIYANDTVRAVKTRIAEKTNSTFDRVVFIDAGRIPSDDELISECTCYGEGQVRASIRHFADEGGRRAGSRSAR